MIIRPRSNISPLTLFTALLKHFEDSHTTDSHISEASIELAVNSLLDFTDEEIVTFCNMTRIKVREANESSSNTKNEDDPNGLWLLLWYDDQHKFSRLTDTIEDRLIKLPNKLFTQLHFFNTISLKYGTELSALQFIIPKTELLNKAMTAFRKLTDLPLTAKIEIEAAQSYEKRMPNGLLILIACYYDSNHVSDREFQNNFLKLAAHAPIFDQDGIAIIKWLLVKHTYQQPLLEALLAINKLKLATNKEKDLPYFEETEKVADKIFKNQKLSPYHIFFANLIRTMLPKPSFRLSCELTLLLQNQFSKTDSLIHFRQMSHQLLEDLSKLKNENQELKSQLQESEKQLAAMRAAKQTPEEKPNNSTTPSFWG